MRNRGIAVAAALLVAALTPVVSAGQAPDGWTMPRTADGHPNLQGIWANDSATPFQRPESLGERATLTNEEVAAMAAYMAEYDSVGGDAVFGDTPYLRALAAVQNPTEEEERAARRSSNTSTRSYNQFWMIEGRDKTEVRPRRGHIDIASRLIRFRLKCKPIVVATSHGVFTEKIHRLPEPLDGNVGSTTPVCFGPFSTAPHN